MENNDNLQLKTNETIVREKPNDVFNATTKSLEELKNSYSYYLDCLRNFSEGTTKVELRKRYMLKVLDKTWVDIMEDTLPAIDAIIRNPGGGLEEFEEVKPIELTRKVVPKSVVHLSQHTDLINEITKDGMVMPSKLLNVYNDETMLTYENKFINTLIQRIYAFVMLRYDAACACGEDERNTVFTYSQNFEEGERKGKINVTIEVADPPKDGEVIKNYIYTTDLWRRVLRIVDMTKSCVSSKFVKEMGKNYIHPPIMRTNKLLKNVNFKQCLTLWEFLEQYENTGYETMIQESLEDINDDFLKNFYNAVVAQYVLFNKTINNEFNPKNTLDERTTDVINARVKDVLDDIDLAEYDYVHSGGKVEVVDDEKATEKEEKINYAIEVTNAALDQLFKGIEAEPDISIGYMFEYSFLGRLILAQNPCQDYYTEIKNYILSYDNVKSNISWKHELFKYKKDKVCKLAMKGKTLCIYLPLDPSKYIDEKHKYNDLTGSKANIDTPLMVKIKNNKHLKEAIELVDIVMANLCIIKVEDYKVKDYHKKYKTPLDLCYLNPPLARLINGELPLRESKLEIKYNYSFLGRLNKAENPCQDYYTIIKNKLLSIKEIDDNISWKHELFKNKRNKICLLNVKGKALVLYLPINPKELEGSKYKFKDVSTKKQFNDIPVLFKVKNERNLKYTLELIDMVIKNQELNLLKKVPNNDYHMEVKTVDELLAMNPPLVKLNGDKIKTPVFNPMDYCIIPEKAKIIRNNYSFIGRLTLVQSPAQDYYNSLKNELLSYSNIKSNISWHHELFKLGRTKIAKFVMKGKTLNVFLPLNPDEFIDSKYKFIDLRVKKPNTDLPFLVKVTSDRKVNHLIELINIVMNNNNIIRKEDYINTDYHLEYKTIQELASLNPPLVKLGNENEEF